MLVLFLSSDTVGSFLPINANSNSFHSSSGSWSRTFCTFCTKSRIFCNTWLLFFSLFIPVLVLFLSSSTVGSFLPILANSNSTTFHSSAVSGLSINIGFTVLVLFLSSVPLFTLSVFDVLGFSLMLFELSLPFLSTCTGGSGACLFFRFPSTCTGGSGAFLFFFSLFIFA